MTRTFFLIVLAVFAVTRHAVAQTTSAPPAASANVSLAFEIVKQDIDLEVAPNGQSWEVSETRLRPLTTQGVKALQQTTLSYTSGYQQLDVKAYTLKKDGREIDIPQSDILQGHGATTAPGFEDTRTLTVVFPNLEVGDQTVLLTRTAQMVPWFPDVFAAIQPFSDTIVVRDGKFTLTIRGNTAPYHIVASRVNAEAPITFGGKTRYVWRFHNDSPKKPEPGAVAEYEDLPRVEVSSLSDYAQVAKIYAKLFRDKTDVTPEISALADKVTAGARDHRTQAKLLYEWVAGHIEYVNIVLGAGGFQPHKAVEVLKNGYGDCKDHVMLLQALLAAKGIKSSAVLIRAGINQYKLPSAASPFLFDHLISYVPELKIYLDSTARYAPFDVLPASDAGKSVVIVETGKTAVTPPDSARTSSIRVDTIMTLNADGSADGDAKVHSAGTAAIAARALMISLPLDGDTDFFRAVLGPGSDGRFDRGKPEDLNSDYDYSAHFHLGHAANMPGPGAINALAGYKPFSFTALIGSDMPPKRDFDYACISGIFEDSVTLTLPPGVAVTALPASKVFATDGAEMRADYQQLKPDTVHALVRLKLDRPGPVCRAADYAKVRPQLSAMVDALLAQILYR